ncbi:hypothetical protein L1987_59581 [Smallanthus sonchifolius]|uniref:Uncharacterized protein n=1 Tax=Smallanthus sonchifolius TaxID=185202 RepID=A0ACB9D678_9ASTR|nr:hypothetical protein L1987_59581 [Smallanthus sonchifolius]
MVSKKKYIFTIDDDCFVAKDPSGKDINALEQHIKNLLTPSTPFFFNTLYDPYREGADFVRGYPFSLCEGFAFWVFGWRVDILFALQQLQQLSTKYYSSEIFG